MLAWNGHPYHVVIDNSFGNFEKKLRALELSLAKLLLVKLDDSLSVQTLTFELDRLPQFSIPSSELEVMIESKVNVEINSTLLSRVEMEFPLVQEWVVAAISLIRRKQNDDCSYWMELTLSDSNQIEVLKRLTLAAYQSYMNSSKVSSPPVDSNVTHFVVGHSTFALRETLNAGFERTTVKVHCLNSGSPQYRSPSGTDPHFHLPDFIKECNPTLCG